MSELRLERELRELGERAHGARPLPDPAPLLDAFERELQERASRHSGLGPKGFVAALVLATGAALVLNPAEQARAADRGLLLRAEQIARAITLRWESLR